MSDAGITGDSVLAVLLDASWRVLLLSLIGLAVLYLHRRFAGPRLPLSVMPVAICCILLLSMIRTPLSLQVITWPDQLFSSEFKQEQTFTSDAGSRRYRYHEVTPSWALPLLTVWIAGCLWFIRRPVAGLYGIHLLRRNARVADDPHMQVLVRRACQVRGIRRPVEVRFSTQIHTACCWGVLRPHIFLPENACRWGRQRLWHTLLHECAHIKDRDSIGIAVMELLVALFWFIPSLHVLARMATADCEARADSAVLNSGVAAPDYAATLLRTAKEMQTSTSTIGIALAGAHPLEQRITSILHRQPAGERSSAIWRFGLLVLFAVSLICFGMTNPWKQVAESAVEEEILQ